MKHILIYLALVLFSGAIVYAADSTAAAEQPVTFSGFVDFYYSKNIESPLSGTNRLRNFDTPENQFTLSLAELVVQKTASPVGFRMDLDFGPTNDAVQPGNASTVNVLQQAYLTAVLPVGNGLTVDAGKFVTHMGYEVIESQANWNYSRSLLFAWAIPYYHTGIRLTYPVANNFTAALHIVNGWNSVIDNNSKKSLGLTLNYAVSSSTDFIFNYMTGFEQPQGVNAGKKNVFDFIITQSVSDKFTLALNADYGEERFLLGAPLATWKGAAVYGRYAFNDKSAIAIRAEGFYDPMGYATATGVPKETIKEATLTYEYKLFAPLLVRGEARGDFANAPLFENNSGGTTQYSQVTFLIGVVASF
ncbi:MAG: porin [Bacteroidota bacterium]|nr:porin [Bacteroidota bacterium]